jgi:hypothetical protein
MKGVSAESVAWNLERQLRRGVNQLARLQRLRLGEALPPPLTMEVSERA